MCGIAGIVSLSERGVDVSELQAVELQFGGNRRGELDEDVMDRPKHRFAVPLGRWFRGQLAPFVRDLLLSEASRRRGLFNRAYIELLLAELDRGRPLDFQLWTLISFEMWCRTFVDRSTSTRSDLTSDTAFDITVAVEGQSRHPVPGPDAVAPSQAPCWTS